MAGRYTTLTYTTATIAAGATSSSVDTNQSITSSQVNIVKIKVVPNTLTGPFTLKVYKSASLSSSELLSYWSNATPQLFYPSNMASGTAAEGLEGYPIVYDDDDSASQIHLQLTNNDTAPHTYTVTVKYEIAINGLSPILTSPQVVNGIGIGGAASTGNSIVFYGTSSGAVTVKALAAAGTWTWSWPNSAGTASYPLITDGSGNASWTLLPLAGGGTGAALTASNGGIFYSTGSVGAILAGTATAGQILQSGSSAAPAWSTATYPAVAGTANKAIISDGTNFSSATLSLASAQFANQGTTTTLLHGNAAGNPSFGAVVSADLASTTGSGTTIVLSTSPTFGTGITVPLVIGGSAVGQALTFQTTTGVGTTDSIVFKGGNNGATTWLKVLNTGLVQGGGLQIGSFSGTQGGLWAGNVTPDATNYILWGSAGGTAVNAPSGSALTLQYANGNQVVTIDTSGLSTASTVNFTGTTNVHDVIPTTDNTYTYGNLTHRASNIYSPAFHSGASSMLFKTGAGDATALTLDTGQGASNISTFAGALTVTGTLTTPLVIGGSAVGQALTFQTTTGVGTTDSIVFKGGNNGGTTYATLDFTASVPTLALGTGGEFRSSGVVGFTSTSNGALIFKNNGSTRWTIGDSSSNYSLFPQDDGITPLASISKRIANAYIIGLHSGASSMLFKTGAGDATALTLDTGQGASNLATFAGALTVTGVLTGSGNVKTAAVFPASDSTSALQLRKSDGTTSVLSVDTTNSRVGIGDEAFNPAKTLEVRTSGAAPTTAIVFSGDRTAYGIVSGTLEQVVGGSAATDILYLGMTNSAAGGVRALSIDGNGKTTLTGKFFTTGLTTSGSAQTDNLCLSSGNEVIADTVGCVASSLRYKDLVAEMTAEEAIRIVTGLDSGWYQYKQSHRAVRAGFSAEQAAPLEPRLVGFNDEGLPNNFDYQCHTVVLNKAIQSLLGTIRTLEARIDTLGGATYA